MVDVLNVVQGVQGVQAGLAVAGVRLPSFSLAQISAWRGSLQAASWRGVPFFVEAAELHAGRNAAIHAYPFRESNPVWVEDAGLAPTSHRIVGFLVGDNVAQQQNAMLAAVQARGPGRLVHPMRGSRTGSIVGGCRFLLRKDRGRYIEITFEFIEGDDFNPYPLVGAPDQSPAGPDNMPDDPRALQQDREAYFAYRQDSIQRSIQTQRAYRESVTGSSALTSPYLDSTAPVGVNPYGSSVPAPSSASTVPIEQQREAYFAYRQDSIQRSIQTQRAYRDSVLGQA